MVTLFIIAYSAWVLDVFIKNIRVHLSRDTYIAVKAATAATATTTKTASFAAFFFVVVFFFNFGRNIKRTAYKLINKEQRKAKKGSNYCHCYGS